ncbi:MAG TPA: signal peptidase, partial [Gemmobacter sp.]|nr:signal peptidase [Gemmobacter sp.]
MLKPAALLLALLAVPAQADVAEVVAEHALPGLAKFTATTAALAAEQSCDPARLRPLYHQAFDAWAGVAHLRLGPVEEQGRVLAIAFWPDPKGLGAKAQAALLKAADPA